MQQDQRIGLAFGVLLIGACAAFFFRNETRERSQTPQLQNAQQLDDRIAQKANRPYLTGIKTVEAGGRSRVRIVADRAHDTDEEHSDLSWSPPGPFGSRNGGASRADMESDVLELDPIPVPGELRSTNATTQENTPAEAQRGAGRLGQKADATASETHIVQKGETLSSIATKRLGNANRFHEIFEANQSQMKDANALKVGMILQIPDKGQPSPESTGSIDDSIPSSLGHRRTAPRREIEELSNAASTAKSESIDSQNESPIDRKPPSESSPAKFVPARRFTSPTRPSGSRNGRL